MSTSPPGVDPVEVAAPAVGCSNVVCWHVSSIVSCRLCTGGEPRLERNAGAARV